MERRSFLQGIFGGIAGGALLINAPKESLEAFAGEVPEGSEVASSLISAPPDPTLMSPGMFVYDSQGHILGILIGYQMTRDIHDTTMMGDQFTRSVPGPTRIVGSFAVSGYAEAIIRGR